MFLSKLIKNDSRNLLYDLRTSAVNNFMLNRLTIIWLSYQIEDNAKEEHI
jgi:hypothetical protein